MKNKGFWLITTLMTIALLGVFVMQLYYIKEAYHLKSQLFDEQVNQTLSAVVNKLQRKNAFEHINRKDAELRDKRFQDARQRAWDVANLNQEHTQLKYKRKHDRRKQIERYLNEQIGIIRSSYLKPTLLSESDYQALTSRNYTGAEPTRLNYQISGFVDENLKLKAVEVNPKLISPNMNLPVFDEVENLPDTIRYLVIRPDNLQPLLISLPKISDDLVSKFKKEDLQDQRKLDQRLAQINLDSARSANTALNQLEDVAKEMSQLNVPLSKRLHLGRIDTLIRSELINHNIKNKYNYRIATANKDSLLFQKVGHQTSTFLPENTYKTALFANDVIRDPGMLYLSFPDKNSTILNNLKVTVASSIGLLMVLLFIFTYTLYAILKQKKISEMKTDFINNMTHEFKTPVATIMIASESLQDPEIMADEKRVKRLAHVIYDENVRLGNHIERVLSIARLEKNQIKMSLADLDVNALIAAVVDSMDLQLQRKSALVELDLQAQPAIIQADELYFSNVIYNLIDNANKYCKDKPEIFIKTYNQGHNLVIEIEDKGIGMTKEHSKRIFDQFYRVPTGNLHDVKGFGLGLNYVKEIVQQLQGKIQVFSEKDKGTRFDIILPLHP